MTQDYKHEDMQLYERIRLVIETMYIKFPIDVLHGDPVWVTAVEHLDSLAVAYCLPDINAVLASVDKDIDALSLAEGDAGIDPDAPIPYTLTGADADDEGDAGIDPDAPIPYTLTGADADDEGDDDLSPFGTLNGTPLEIDDDSDDPRHFRSFPHHAPRDLGDN